MALSPAAPAAAAELRKYTACDVSDALLKLGVPGAGFIADLHRYSPLPTDAASSVVAPVSTVLFVARGEAPTEPASNVPPDAHWADVTEPGTFVVIKQPPGQTNAVCGGIMALRMKVRQVRGIAVAGRVRDLPELRSTSLPVSHSAASLAVWLAKSRCRQIWACGVSTVGAGGGSIPWALQVPLDINGVTVRPGDVAFDDAGGGIIVILGDKVDQVLELLPKLTAADDKVKQDVLSGMSVHEAFKLHRGA